MKSGQKALNGQEKYDLHYAIFKTKIKPLLEDGIIEIINDQLNITEAGRPFVRNVCMTLDSYLDGQTYNSQRFSSTV